MHTAITTCRLHAPCLLRAPCTALQGRPLRSARRWSREDGFSLTGGAAHTTVGAALQQGTSAALGGSGEGRCDGSSDRATARHLRTRFRRNSLMTSTPTRVTGDRSKVRSFAAMLREFESIRNQGWVVGPIAYAVAISVCSSVITVTQCNHPGQKTSILLAAEKLYDEYRRLESHKPYPQAHKTRVYSAIMHSYLRGGVVPDCVRVIQVDMPAAGLKPSAVHYTLVVGALGRQGSHGDAWKLVLTLRSSGLPGVAGPHMHRALLGGAPDYASAKRCVMQFARWGVPLDPPAARAFIQSTLRGAGLTSLWGLADNASISNSLGEGVRREILQNTAASREYILRVGTPLVSDVHAALMHALAVGGDFSGALRDYGRLPEDVSGTFYVLSTLMYVCSQAIYSGDASGVAWVDIAEKAFQRAEIGGAAGRSSVFYTRLMCVYAAAGEARRAKFLMRHMHESGKNLRPSPGMLASYQQVRGDGGGGGGWEKGEEEGEAAAEDQEMP